MFDPRRLPSREYGNMREYGIVFLTLLLMQSLLTYLKIVWIDSGLIRNLNLIGMLTLLELKAEV